MFAATGRGSEVRSTILTERDIAGTMCACSYYAGMWWRSITQLCICAALVCVTACSRREPPGAPAQSTAKPVPAAAAREGHTQATPFNASVVDKLLDEFISLAAPTSGVVRFDSELAQSWSFAELFSVATSCPDPLVAFQYGMAAVERAADSNAAALARLYTARYAMQLWDVATARALLGHIPADQSSYWAEQYYIQRLSMEAALAEAVGDFATAGACKERKARLVLQYDTPGVATPNPQPGIYGRYAGFLIAAARDYIVAGHYKRARGLLKEVLSADRADPGYDNISLHQRAAETDLARFDDLIRAGARARAEALRDFERLRALYNQYGSSWLAELHRYRAQKGGALQAWEVYALKNKMQFARTQEAQNVSRNQ